MLKSEVQGFKDLGRAMQSAFESAGKAAEEANQKATELLQRAAATRLSAQDRITELSLEGASPDDADAVRGGR